MFRHLPFLIIFSLIVSVATAAVEESFADRCFRYNMAIAGVRLVHQTDPQVQAGKTACAPVSVVNTFSLVLASNGHPPLANPVAEINEVQTGRGRLGSTYRETMEMIQKMFAKHLPDHDFRVAAKQLDFPERLKDAAVKDVGSLAVTDLPATTSREPGTHYDFVQVLGTNGTTPLSHMFVVVGKNPISGDLRVLDPSTGKFSEYSTVERSVNGKKTFQFKLQSERDADNILHHMDSIVATGFITLDTKPQRSVSFR